MKLIFKTFDDYKERRNFFSLSNDERMKISHSYTNFYSKKYKFAESLQFFANMFNKMYSTVKNFSVENYLQELVNNEELCLYDFDKHNKHCCEKSFNYYYSYVYHADKNIKIIDIDKVEKQLKSLLIKNDYLKDSDKRAFIDDFDVLIVQELEKQIIQDLNLEYFDCDQFYNFNGFFNLMNDTQTDLYYKYHY